MANGWYQPTKALFSSVPTSGYGLLNPSEAFGQASRLSKRLTAVNIEYVQAWLARSEASHRTRQRPQGRDRDHGQTHQFTKWRSSRSRR